LWGGFLQIFVGWAEEPAPFLRTGKMPVPQKRVNFLMGFSEKKQQAQVLFQRTFAMRQGLQSLSDFSKREKVIQIVPTRG
jgi:hypothetical protein